MIDRNGVQIRVLGDVGLLPARVQAVCREVVEATKGNKRCVLNFCFPYTCVFLIPPLYAQLVFSLHVRFFSTPSVGSTVRV